MIEKIEKELLNPVDTIDTRFGAINLSLLPFWVVRRVAEAALKACEDAGMLPPPLPYQYERNNPLPENCVYPTSEWIMGWEVEDAQK